jgi:hypothetical protein
VAPTAPPVPVLGDTMGRAFLVSPFEVRDLKQRSAFVEDCVLDKHPPHVVALYERLIHDRSDLSIRNSANLLALAGVHSAVLAAATPIGTARKDVAAWNYWTTFTHFVGTNIWRHDARANSGADREGHEREVFLLNAFLIFVHYSMKPRSAKDPAARPASALACVAGVKRRHAELNYEMAKTPGMKNTLKGLLALYVAEHGPESLIPKRKEPLTNAHTEAILSVPDGTSIRGLTVAWTSLLYISFAAFLCVLRHTGSRKADLLPVGDDAFDEPVPLAAQLASRLGIDVKAHVGITRISTGGKLPARSNLTWLIRGVRCADPSSDLLRSLGPGDRAVYAPGGSKSDPDATVFGNMPVYLPYLDEPTNAAFRLAALELAAPVHGSNRARSPLFPAEEPGVSLNHALADRMFAELAEFALGVLTAATLSLHSGRVWLACAMLARRCSGPLIQAFCRWKSPESVKIYARINPEYYANTLLDVFGADVSSVCADNLPQTDDDMNFAQLHADGAIDQDDISEATGVPRGKRGAPLRAADLTIDAARAAMPAATTRATPADALVDATAAASRAETTGAQAQRVTPYRAQAPATAAAAMRRAQSSVFPLDAASATQGLSVVAGGEVAVLVVITKRWGYVKFPQARDIQKFLWSKLKRHVPAH